MQLQLLACSILALLQVCCLVQTQISGLDVMGRPDPNMMDPNDHETRVYTYPVFPV